MNMCRFMNISGVMQLISCLGEIENFTEENKSLQSINYNENQNNHDKNPTMVEQNPQTALLNESFEYYDYEDIDDIQWTLVIRLNMYYIPVLIVVGFVGNLLSCVVFLNTRLRMRSSSYYLAALAIADVSYLFMLFLVWLDMLGFNTFNINVFCQLEIYLASMSSTLSVWLTVAYTMERFIAVQYPLQRPTVCTVHRAKSIILTLTVISGVWHIYVFITAGLSKDDPSSDILRCNLKREYKDLMTIINWFDTSLTLVIPFICIVIMNTLIARQLFKFSRRCRQRDGDTWRLREIERSLPNGCNKTGHGASGSSPCVSSSGPKFPPAPAPSSTSSNTKNNNNVKIKTNFAASAATGLLCIEDAITVGQPRGRICRALSTSYPSHRSILSTRTQYSITKMLLLISTVFILLNLPSHMIRVHAFLAGLWGPAEMDVNNETFFWNLQQVFMQLQYTHHSINFLFYSCCGATFRKCLMQLLPVRLRLFCCRRNTNSQRYQ